MDFTILDYRSNPDISKKSNFNNDEKIETDSIKVCDHWIGLSSLKVKKNGIRKISMKMILLFH
jgi:hypothetical protein